MQLSQGLRKLFKSLGVEDNSTVQARETFSLAADFVSDRLNIAKGEALSALHHVCKETDPDIIDLSAEHASDQAIETVAKSLERIRVQYCRIGRGRYERLLTVQLTDNRKRIKRDFRSDISWDELPSEVREEAILDGRDSADFDIYP
jgi:hypothetical protein